MEKKTYRDLTYEERLAYIRWLEDKETSYEDNVVCPYCGHEHEPSEDPSFYYTLDNTEVECDECGEVFEFSGDIRWTFGSNRKNTEVTDWLKELENDL